MIDRYIHMRNSKTININWFYEYFMQNTKIGIDINNFSGIFNMMNINETLDYLDKKFNLFRIYDKNNNFVKVFK